MDNTEFKKLTDEFSANIKGIQDRITDLEKAKLDKDLIDSEINPAIEALKKKADELDIKQKELEAARRVEGVDSSPESRAFWKWFRKGEKVLGPEEVKVLKISDDTTGGYLATPEFAAGILKQQMEYSPIRSVASVRTTSRESVEFVTRANQFSANWVGEVAARTETTGLAFGKERIPTHELYARVDVSNWDLEDSDYNLEGIIQDEFAERFGVAEGTSFVSGNTTYQPEGILTNANVGSSNSGNATSIASGDAFITLYFTGKSAYTRNFKWLMRRASMALIAKLKDNNSNYLLRRLGESPVWNILGSDVVECPDMPAIANAAYPIAGGDFKRGYQIVDRIGLAVLRDPYSAANTNSVIFHARKRVGGKVIMAEAITKMLIST